MTSIKIDPELWKRAKLIAVRKGTTLKSIIESLLSGEVEAEEAEEAEYEGLNVSEELLKALVEKRQKGELPFAIQSRMRAVELVREGRGK